MYDHFVYHLIGFALKITFKADHIYLFPPFKRIGKNWNTPMKSEIKVYLESPQTLAVEPVTKQVKQRRKATKKRKERIPKFVAPPQNIYLTTDYSKLTERQRLMALRFQSLKDKAKSLFLAVNNIDVALISNTIKKNDELPVTRENESNLVKSPKSLKSVKKVRQNKSKPCNQCFSDIFKLSQFLIWLNQKHSCGKVKKLKSSTNRIQKIVKECKCICTEEEKIYSEIHSMLEIDCCL